MCDEQEMEVQLQIVRDDGVEVRLGIIPARLLGSPAPQSSQSVDVCVDGKRFPFQAPGHDDRGGFGSDPLVLDELLHRFLIVHLEDVIEIPIQMFPPHLFENSHDQSAFPDVQSTGL